MSRIMKLRQRKADLVAEATALTAKEDAGALSAEETARLDDLTKDGGELDKANAAIQREERLMDDRRSMAAVSHENDDAEDDVQPRRHAEARRDVERFASLGEQLVAVAQAGAHGVSASDRDRRLVWQGPGSANQRQASAGQNEASGPEGGFLVQQDFADELLTRAYERSELARRTRNIPISGRSNGLRINAVKETSRANGARFGGVQAFWTGEGQEKRASELKFREMDLRLHKLTGLLYCTDEVLEDAVALEALIDMAFEEEFAFKIDWAIFEGTGSGMPLGFMRSQALISVAKEAGQGADTIVVENLLKMRSRLWARSRRTAVWLINQEIEPQLQVLKIGDTPVYLPNSSLADDPYDRLLGRPVIPTEFNAGLGDRGDIVLTDLQEYLMIKKGQVKKDVSIHVRFIHDETAFRFVVRIDGQPVWESPLLPFKGVNSVSPFVALDERA